MNNSIIGNVSGSKIQNRDWVSGKFCYIKIFKIKR